MAIALGNVASNFSASGSFNITHSLSAGVGNNRLVVVAASVKDTSLSTEDVTGITFNGVAMTLAGYVKTSAGYLKSSMYYILDADLPANAGDYTIAVSIDGDPSSGGGAVSADYTGVKQAAPDAVVTDSTDATTLTISTTIGFLSDNAWGISAGGVNANLSQAATNTATRDIQIFNATIAAGVALSHRQANTGTRTFGWTVTSNNRQTHVLASFAPSLETNATVTAPTMTNSASMSIPGVNTSATITAPSSSNTSAMNIPTLSVDSDITTPAMTNTANMSTPAVIADSTIIVPAMINNTDISIPIVTVENIGPDATVMAPNMINNSDMNIPNISVDTAIAVPSMQNITEMATVNVTVVNPIIITVPSMQNITSMSIPAILVDATVATNAMSNLCAMANPQIRATANKQYDIYLTLLSRTVQTQTIQRKVTVRL